MRRLALTVTALFVLAATALAVAAPASAAWMWPVSGEVITPYRNGTDPYATGQHRGIDIAASVGAPVVAAAGGEVRFAGTAGSSGLTISIRTSDGYDTSYLHLSSAAVRAGARVSAGERIGAVGTSGTRSATAPHLHFGVRDAGTQHAYHDPLAFLPPPPGGPSPNPPPAAPAPAPQPAPPAAAPAPLPKDAPARRPRHAPAPRGAPGPVRGHAPTPIRRPAPSPVRRPTPSPVRRPTPNPVRRPAPSPVGDHAPSPIRQRAPGTVGDHAPSPVRGLVPSPVGDSAPSPLRRSVPRSDPRRHPARGRDSAGVHGHGPSFTAGTESQVTQAGPASSGPRSHALKGSPATPQADARSSGPDIGWVLACAGLLLAAAILGLTGERRADTGRSRSRLAAAFPLLGRR
jgi:hypothetical protein